MRTSLSKAVKHIGTLGGIPILLASLMCAVTRGQEPVDTIRVDSDLVDLKVSVVSLTPKRQLSVLSQSDFHVFENGAQQEITFFAAADAPFDLVLLLDLSGSTSEKIGLIRKSSKRFVDAARPNDRIAVVTFTDVARVVSDLTGDREALKKAIDKIEKPVSGTNFWDALRFTSESILNPKLSSNRRAVVVMTDGVDNALPDVYGPGSITTFDELLESVRRTDLMVFPIYLDTEIEEAKKRRTPREAYMIARRQLGQLAEASGTVLYSASELKHLDKVYEQVIHDLGTVYSIGYRPTNEAKDGSWRAVAVKVPSHQELTARTKSGYFAKTEAESKNR
jgi:VWFA-related protein